MKTLEELSFESLEARGGISGRRRIVDEGKRVHREGQGLAQHVLEAHRHIERRGHSLEVHLDRPARDARDLRERSERQASFVTHPTQRRRIEPDVEAPRRREEEGRDALLEEFMERAPTEDRHPEPTVDHSVLQGAGATALADDEGRAVERPRDRLEFLGGLLAQRVHVLEDLHDQQGVIASRDHVEAEAALPVRSRKEEARLREGLPRLLHNRVALHGSFIV